jgi:alpha-1,3/alpha-1,6-mannosyltransferase
VIGGYDDKVPDNIQTLKALQTLCDKFSFTHTTLDLKSTTPSPDLDVYFLLNFSSSQRTYLLQSPNTIALLYTPRNEHFGIVPVEAMACGLPVLAVNSGGPLETIIDCIEYENGTGILRPPSVDEWAKALDEIVGFDDDRRESIKEAGMKRAQGLFSLETLGGDLDQAAQEAMREGRPGLEDGLLLLIGGIGFVGAISIVGSVLYLYWPADWEPLI